MEASNGAGLAVATSAKDDLRQQSMLRNGSASRATPPSAGHPPMSGIASNDSGRGYSPRQAAAAFSPAPHGQFRLMPVALPRAAEWNRRIADWLAA